ncbi:MAG TPA: hypothetical protein VEC43_01390, partial [Candidatus Acidoferrales bacterium]|nr:hypothetical protein [Candidatus Acidoferrales bacterium]
RLEGTGEHPLSRITNPTLLQHALWMEREGCKRSTIKSSVKTLLATATYTQNRKHKIITDVSRLYRQLGIKWERPRSGQNGGNHRQPMKPDNAKKQGEPTRT